MFLRTTGPLLLYGSQDRLVEETDISCAAKEALQ